MAFCYYITIDSGEMFGDGGREFVKHSDFSQIAFVFVGQKKE